MAAIVETSQSASKDDIYAATTVKKFNGRKVRCYMNFDAKVNPASQRTIVISNIEGTTRMEDVVHMIDKISPIVSFEYASKYTNPELPETEELLLKLNTAHLEKVAPHVLENRPIEIHESDGDRVNIIRLKPDLSISSPILSSTEESRGIQRDYSESGSMKPVVFRSVKHRQ